MIGRRGARTVSAAGAATCRQAAVDLHEKKVVGRLIGEIDAHKRSEAYRVVGGSGVTGALNPRGKGGSIRSGIGSSYRDGSADDHIGADENAQLRPRGEAPRLVGDRPGVAVVVSIIAAAVGIGSGSQRAAQHNGAGFELSACMESKGQ